MAPASVTLPPGFLLSFLKSQLFTRPPPPTHDFSNQVILITGSNTGLGLEAARHFVRLNTAKVILGVRSIQKGEAAALDIEQTTGRKGVVQVWEVDFSSYKSVEVFCGRAAKEERLDVVIANAGVAIPRWEQVEGTERTVLVNVLATFLMVVLMVPILRKSGEKHGGVPPRLVVVSSEAHEQASFVEQDSPPGQIFTTLASNKPSLQPDRYNTSKLLEVLLVRALAPDIYSPSSTPHPEIILNTLTPGLCKSLLMRHAVFPLNIFAAIGKVILARSTEVGSRTLVAAAAAGNETHGKYMADCRVREPSRWVRSEKGKVTQQRVWEEVREILEGVREGCTKCLD
ncbi:hypothetical protein HYALB_00011830 [Hymenoscyphus albidus]|uniref:Uncharacterized protein n=1 Tax=Hymenoscyphus albidus TaxID=595503 RepID=A0A9N9LP66_9HELO|nr:hypothetical protein HYALB_00011830 [Hymenoscyphus albidus]